MNLSGATILVTGGAGLVGSATIDLLLQSGDLARVVILDDLSRGTAANLEAALRDPRVVLLERDIRDRAAVETAMRGVDAVMHFAALRITSCAAEPREAFEVMCAGSYNVVEAAQRAGVRRVVAASTASVYGLADRFPTPEDHHPYNNRTWYGASKVMLEGLLRSFNDMYGLPYVALRYFNVYGPRMDIHGKYTEVLIRWMERIENGQPPLILGDGTQTMDFVYVEDVARANVLALTADVSDEVFNVGTGIETSLNDLARLLARVMERRIAPEYGPERQVNAVPRRLASTEKAEKLLGFRASIGLEDGLRRLVTWWRAERAERHSGARSASVPERSVSVDRSMVVVTGGAGFIGSELVRQLASRGERVVVVDNLINGKRENLAECPPGTVTLVEADVRDLPAVRPHLRGARIVYHLACLGVRHSLHSPLENHDVNATATLHLLDASRDAGVPKFVYVSSSEVYGTASRVPMTEDHPTSPSTVYGASKLAGECYARAFCVSHGYPTVVVRPFNTYGPRCHHEGDGGEVIPKFVLRCLAGKPMIVFGDGTQTRDFTFVEDTARGIILAGTTDNAVGRTLNLGSEREITINDLARTVGQAVGCPARIVHDDPRPGDVLRLCADISHARSVLGFAVQIPLGDGLARLLAWYRAQGRSPEDMLRDEIVRNWDPKPAHVPGA